MPLNTLSTQRVTQISRGGVTTVAVPHPTGGTVPVVAEAPATFSQRVETVVQDSASGLITVGVASAQAPGPTTPVVPGDRTLLDFPGERYGTAPRVKPSGRSR